ASKRSKSFCDGCWVAKSRITCVNTNGNTTLTEAQRVSLRITSGMRGVGLCVADSHTGYHPGDDFTPLATIRRSYSIIRERIPFELKGETFEPERRVRYQAPQSNVMYASMNALLSTQLTNYSKAILNVQASILFALNATLRFTRSLNTSWEYSPKRLVIYHRGQGTEMDFRSFMIQGVDGEFKFLPEGGFEDNQGSFSAKSVNNETPILDAEPISDCIPTSSFPVVGEKSKAAGKRKLVVDALREGSHRKARRAPVHASKVVGDASTPLDVDSDPDIHEFPSARASCDAIREREVKRYKAYAELEKKCNEALQDLDKNPLIFICVPKLRLYRGQEIDILRQDRVAVISKFVPDAAMKLFHSDEMGILISRLVRETIVHGRCMKFKEIAKLNEPFILEKMPSYRMSSKDEYDQAGDDMANASFPFFSKFTSNPYASVE
nr:hypothetical protein [Tanacetum cinerariifolium]